MIYIQEAISPLVGSWNKNNKHVDEKNSRSSYYFACKLYSNYINQYEWQ